MQDRLTQKITFLSYVTIIFMLSLIPAGQFEISFWKYDKLIHFVEYLIMGFLTLNCFPISSYHKKQIIYCVLFGIFVATTDEFIIQNFFGLGRIPDIYDWGVDIIAATIGIITRKLIGSFIP